MIGEDPSLRSGFRLRAPAALTPAQRLDFASGDLISNGFGKNVDASHKNLRGSCSVSQMGQDKAKRVSNRDSSGREGRLHALELERANEY
jgi:hypothetical protein